MEAEARPPRCDRCQKPAVSAVQWQVGREELPVEETLCSDHDQEVMDHWRDYFMIRRTGLR
jgi:hypothetical protein